MSEVAPFFSAPILATCGEMHMNIAPRTSHAEKHANELWITRATNGPLPETPVAVFMQIGQRLIH